MQKTGKIQGYNNGCGQEDGPGNGIAKVLQVEESEYADGCDHCKGQNDGAPVNEGLSDNKCDLFHRINLPPVLQLQSK
jgi:hypothetical protein